MRSSSEPGRLAMPRRRGAATGLLIALLGAWGAAIPFVGHYFDFVIGPDRAFDMTPGRFWLSLLPGVVAIVGGWMLLRSANRATATLGAQLALAAGVWFVVGPTVSMVWNGGAPDTGLPKGGGTQAALELLGYYYAVGAAIVAFAALALGRVTARHAGDVERLRPEPVKREERTPSGRFSRDDDRDGRGEEAAPQGERETAPTPRT